MTEDEIKVLKKGSAAMNRITLDKYPDILLVDDIRTILRIGRNKAYNLVKTEIPHFQLGKIYCIAKSDLINYINNK